LGWKSLLTSSSTSTLMVVGLSCLDHCHESTTSGCLRLRVPGLGLLWLPSPDSPVLRFSYSYTKGALIRTWEPCSVQDRGTMMTAAANLNVNLTFGCSCTLTSHDMSGQIPNCYVKLLHPTPWTTVITSIIPRLFARKAAIDPGVQVTAASACYRSENLPQYA